MAPYLLRSRWLPLSHRLKKSGTGSRISSPSTSRTAVRRSALHRVAFESNVRSDAQVDYDVAAADAPGAFGRRRDATLARLRREGFHCDCSDTDCDCVSGALLR